MRSRHLEGTFGGPGPALIIGPRPNMLDTSSSCPDLVQALCIPRTWEAHSVDLVQHLFSDLVQICRAPRPDVNDTSSSCADLAQICLTPRPATQPPSSSGPQEPSKNGIKRAVRVASVRKGLFYSWTPPKTQCGGQAFPLARAGETLLAYSETFCYICTFILTSKNTQVKDG